MGFYQIRYDDGDGYGGCYILGADSKDQAIERFGILCFDGICNGNIISTGELMGFVYDYVVQGWSDADAENHVFGAYRKIPGTDSWLYIGDRGRAVAVTDATRQVGQALRQIRNGDRFDSPYDGREYIVNGSAWAEELLDEDGHRQWLLIWIPVLDVRYGWDTDEGIMLPAEWFDGVSAIGADDIFHDGRPYR